MLEAQTHRIAWAIVALLLTARSAQAAVPLGSEFTYQAQLKLDGVPLNDSADFEFTLWDDPTAGVQIGSTQVVNNVTVVDGLFTAELDFGANAFLDDARWLEIRVASPSGGLLTTLSPRQPVTATPFALQTRGIVVENDGDVAIGTSSSVERLTVAKNVDPTIRVENLLDGSAAVQFAATDQEYEWRMKANNKMGFFDNTAGGLERMTIDTSGNVGIGSVNPATKLDVNGTVTASAFVGDGSGLTGIGDGHSLDAADGNPTDALFVDSGGFIGIGTTTPDERLHISAGSPELLLESTGSLATGVQFHNTDYAYSIRMTNGEKFVLRDLTAGNIDRLAIDQTGNVGIGTTSPSAPLHVSGSVLPMLVVESSDSSASRISLSSTATGGQDWNLSSTADGSGLGGGKFAVLEGALARLIIDTGGLVGIGRDPTTNRLEVNGDASKSSAGSWLANSDCRIKKNIKTVENALDAIDKVRLVSFEYTDDYRRDHEGIDSRRYINVIAQEFAEVFPEHVKGSGEYLPDGSEILQVDPYPLTIYSAAAVQELHGQLKEKEAEIESMRAKNAELEARLARIEQMLSNTTGGAR